MIRVLIDECLPRQLLQWLTDSRPGYRGIQFAAIHND
jgi:hypothetical protein